MRLLAVLLLLLPGAAVAQSVAQSAAPYDVLLRGGRVLDGSGNPWVEADVALRDGRVVAMGRLDSMRAATVLDVHGLYVAPGFIDVHSHASGGLAAPDRSGAEPLLLQGVTTVVINPDGGGPFDLVAQREALLADGLGLHVAQLVPHGTVRRAILGEADRQATPDELAQMQALVEAGMEAGAFGLSSGPFYAPGSYADTHELIELARVAARHGGVYTSHIRDESNYTIGLLAAVEEVIEVARAAQLPSVVTHIKALGPPVWGFSTAVVQRIERARAEGVSVYADQYPYPASATGLDAALLPRWAQAGGRDSLVARLQDPALRDSLRRAMTANLARRGGAERIQFRFFAPDTTVQGRTLAAVSAEQGQPPVDHALQMIAAGYAGIVSFNMHRDDVHTFMRQPWTMTASDGSFPPWGVGVPHPRAFGTFPRKIRRYVLEEGVVSLPDAVRSMTSLPAQVFSLHDRGVLRPGAHADVVVFDLDRLRDRATFQAPYQTAEGVIHVFVGGTAAVQDGQPTGVRAGHVLRRHP
ncbi:MAG: D-aminoacylase [Bacteroidota bacterium]